MKTQARSKMPLYNLHDTATINNDMGLFKFMNFIIFFIAFQQSAYRHYAGQLCLRWIMSEDTSDHFQIYGVLFYPSFKKNIYMSIMLQNSETLLSEQQLNI